MFIFLYFFIESVYIIVFVDPTTREDVHLKMLVPSCAAGAVIGKGGETIGKLQRDTGTKMKMSKNQDTFPGYLLYSFVMFHGCKLFLSHFKCVWPFSIMSVIMASVLTKPTMLRKFHSSFLIFSESLIFIDYFSSIWSHLSNCNKNFTKKCWQDFHYSKQNRTGEQLQSSCRSKYSQQ